MISKNFTRTVQGNILSSSALPEMKLQVAEEFLYLGSIAFDLKGVARVERYHFVQAAGSTAARQFIVQFEGWLPDNTYTYSWPSPTPMTLGGVDWQQNPFFYNNAESIRNNPGAETTHTTRFLQEKGFAVKDELMMSRFARIVGADRRNEILLFYLENVAATGHTLAEISEDGDIRPGYEDIAEDLVARSLASFKLLSYREKV